MNEPTIVLYYWDETNRDSYQHHIQRVLKDMSLGGLVHGADEPYLERGVLSNGQLVPSKAIVITHGNVAAHHQNVGFVRRLAPQRTDLQFIISLDKDELLREKFDSGEDWRYVRDKWEEDFTPAHQVTLVKYVLPTFISGHDRRDGTISQSFRDYIIAWKALGGKP